MDRRCWIGIAVAVLILVGAAGLVVENLDPDGRSTGRYLHVEEVDQSVWDGHTEEYSALTPEQRRTFEAALDGDALVELPGDADDDVWTGVDYVRYRDGTYRVGVIVTD